MHRSAQRHGQKQTTACMRGRRVARGAPGQKKCQHPLVKKGHHTGCQAILASPLMHQRGLKAMQKVAACPAWRVGPAYVHWDSHGGPNSQNRPFCRKTPLFEKVGLTQAARRFWPARCTREVPRHCKGSLHAQHVVCAWHKEPL